MEDRRLSRKRKGNVLSSCVTPARMNALEMMALTEKQQEKVQVCKMLSSKTVRIIVGLKIHDKRKLIK